MSSKKPPAFVVNQPSQDEVDGSLLPQHGAVKVNIGRSNSAPQPQNQFTANRMGLKSKASPPISKSPRLPTSTENEHPNGGQIITTLSDGVIHVNQEEAAQAAVKVLTSHEQNRSTSSDDMDNPISPTPLCDSNHSPSSTKRYYQESSSLLRNEPKPEDVWQRREKFGSEGREESVDGDRDLNMSGNSAFSFPKPKSNCNSKEPGSLRNGTHGKPGPSVSSGSLAKGQGMATSSMATVNGHQNATQNPASEENSLSQKTADDREVDLRKSQQRYPLRQAQSEVLPSEVQRKMSLATVKEKGYARLEEELMKAQKALEMKDEEVDELRGIRERLMKEVSDFTASLFEEVNSQLNEAAINEQQAKKQLKEANAKIEVLTAEVVALKNLVLTSTPSSPNKHLHPQIDNANKKEKGGKPFWKTHRRSTSHHQFTKESREKAEAHEHHSLLKEMDTVVFDEFSRWRLQPTMEFSGQFFSRVQQEDIQPCLNFKNTRLSDRLQESVKANTLSIEPIPGDHSFPRKCCLSETHKLCNYKIKFEGDDEWYSISQMARNRIAAVCDFYAYLRYIVQGLVKNSDKDMYAELVRLRSQMSQARLGLI